MTAPPWVLSIISNPFVLALGLVGSIVIAVYLLHRCQLAILWFTNRSVQLSSVNVKLPFGIGEAEITSTGKGREIAWEIYVELMTRIATAELKGGEGICRESLASLHSLYSTIRAALRTGGPDIGVSENSTGGISMLVLNRGLRSFLAKWHSRLSNWEFSRPNDRSAVEHEQCWPDRAEFDSELNELQKELRTYASVLRAVVHAPREVSRIQSVLKQLITWRFGHDVFISYSRGSDPNAVSNLPDGNALAYAVELERQLTGLGLAVFRDNSHTGGGDPLESTILWHLRKSRLIVPLATRGADAHNGWVRKEVNWFRETRSRRFAPTTGLIIPVCFYASLPLERLPICQALDIVNAKNTGIPLTVDDLSSNLKLGMLGDGVAEKINKKITFVRVRTRAMWTMFAAGAVTLVLAVAATTFLQSSSAEQAIAAILKKNDDEMLVDELKSIPAWSSSNVISLIAGRYSADRAASAAPIESGKARNLSRQAAFLFLAGRRQFALKELSYESDPTLRQLLIHRVATVGVAPEEIFAELKAACAANADPGLKQSLLLMLGRFEDDHLSIDEQLLPADQLLPAATKLEAIRLLEELYRKDPDAGVHSAAEWTLTRWGTHQRIKGLQAIIRQERSQEDFLRGLRNGDRSWRWYVSERGEVMSVIYPEMLPAENRPDYIFSIATKETTFQQVEKLVPEFAKKPNPDRGDSKPATLLTPSILNKYFGRFGGESKAIWETDAPVVVGKQQGFRLPTSQEWLAACTGHQPHSYLNKPDSQILGNLSWFRENSGGRRNDFRQITSAAVGKRMPNRFGLFDMLGNVSEAVLISSGNERSVLLKGMSMGKVDAHGGSASKPHDKLNLSPRLTSNWGDDKIGIRSAQTIAD